MSYLWIILLLLLLFYLLVLYSRRVRYIRLQREQQRNVVPGRVLHTIVAQPTTTPIYTIDQSYGTRSQPGMRYIDNNYNNNNSNMIYIRNSNSNNNNLSDGLPSYDEAILHTTARVPYNKY